MSNKSSSLPATIEYHMTFGIVTLVGSRRRRKTSESPRRAISCRRHVLAFAFVSIADDDDDSGTLNASVTSMSIVVVVVLVLMAAAAAAVASTSKLV